MRLVWRLLLVILFIVAVAVLLRFIPISIYTALWVSNGMAEEEALTSAKALIFEDPVWSTILAILNGLLGFILVWFLIKTIEKRSFEWKTVGMDWRRNSYSMLLFGFLLALLLYFADKIAAHALGSSIPSANIILAGISIPILIQKIVLYLSMGFGEEVVFRAYLQTRLVERYGAIRGILIASITFTLVHLGFMSLSFVTIISAVMLWVTIGTLYHWSKSLYLAGMFHGIMNTLLNTLHIEGTEVSGFVVHTVALSIVIAVALRKSRTSGLQSNRA